jgi:hypothetical protein
MRIARKKLRQIKTGHEESKTRVNALMAASRNDGPEFFSRLLE